MYRCIITNGDGEMLTSEVATLVIGTLFRIITQPEDFSGYIGEMAIFTIEANGENLVYQWQWSSNSGTTWRNSSSATPGYNTNTLNVGIVNARNGYRYRCVVTNGAGESIYSEVAILIVIPAPSDTETPALRYIAEN